jgi:hypothetical protein
MEKQRTISAEELLLGARKESLGRINQTALRSHGKLWGMDVFSWIHPNISSIGVTINSFPFSVTWVGNALDLTNALETQTDLTEKLSAVLMFDSTVFNLKNEHLNHIENCVGTGSVSESIRMVKFVAKPQSILLFTASGAGAEDAKIEFENTLKVLQVK